MQKKKDSPASRLLLLRPEPQFVENDRMRECMNTLRTHTEIDEVLQRLWDKDPYTYHHSHRVADFSQWIGKELGLSFQERVEIYLCGLLHDVGKTWTPDKVLKKPGPLSAEEFSIIRLHPEDSGKIVRTIADIAYLEAPIRGHHERIDGKGYPDKKVGDEIHLYSRIILVADTFDAMTTTRVYRKELRLDRTYEELLAFSGTQFDSESVKAFIAVHQKYLDFLSKQNKKAA